MRAAMTDRRPVPAGVNLAPPLSVWTLFGGATYDPVTQEIALPVAGAGVNFWVKVDGASKFNMAWQNWHPVSAPFSLLSVAYFAADKVTPVANSGGHIANGLGSVAVTPGVWQPLTSGTVLGPAVVWVRAAFGATATQDIQPIGRRIRGPVTFTLTRAGAA